MKSKKVLFTTFIIVTALVVGGLLTWWFIYKDGVRNAIPELLAPKQEPASGVVYMDDINGYSVTIKYQYSYEVDALVVHTCDYTSYDIGDRLSPKDLALAWGRVAEMNNEIDFHWEQSHRYYKSHLDPEDERKLGSVSWIIYESSNNHIIPANDEIRDLVGYIRRGDHVKLKGYLVNVSGYRDADRATFVWNSSTSRTDTGPHSCEVFYVTSVEWA